MEKPDQPSTHHADLAALPSATAWRIYWMRFLDQNLGPAVRESLCGGRLLKIVGFVGLGVLGCALGPEQINTWINHAWLIFR